jgi:hypothetical protein
VCISKGLQREGNTANKRWRHSQSCDAALHERHECMNCSALVRDTHEVLSGYDRRRINLKGSSTATVKYENRSPDTRMEVGMG